MTQHISQKFAYEITGAGAVIWRCFSRTGRAEIPAGIDGSPVIKIAPYAFSEHLDPAVLDDKLYTSQEDIPALCGNLLEEIVIPDSVQQVGRYCFYNCDHLRRISFTDTLKDWGSGAFTGCHHVRELEIFIYKDGRSTLKDVLAELPEMISVDYYRIQEGKINGEMEYTHLVFPEFYEEGVENTPARLINLTIHGSGMRYRNCFSQRVLSFLEYDSRFDYAGFQESFLVVAELAEGRLRYPLELSEDARRRYEQFVEKNKEAFSIYMLEKKEMSGLCWYMELLEKLPGISKEVLSELTGLMTERASKLGFYEGLSYLMDYQHRHAKKKQKMSFDL